MFWPSYRLSLAKTDETLSNAARFLHTLGDACTCQTKPPQMTKEQ
jgi:hypothetical protein